MPRAYHRLGGRNLHPLTHSPSSWHPVCLGDSPGPRVQTCNTPSTPSVGVEGNVGGGAAPGSPGIWGGQRVKGPESVANLEGGARPRQPTFPHPLSSPTHRIPPPTVLTPQAACLPHTKPPHSLPLHFYLIPWDSGQRRNLESPCFLLAVPHTSQAYYHFPTPSDYKCPPPPPSLSSEFMHLSRVTEVSFSRKPSQTPTSTGISPSMNAPALAYLGSHTVCAWIHTSPCTTAFSKPNLPLCTRGLWFCHTPAHCEGLSITLPASKGEAHLTELSRQIYNFLVKGPHEPRANRCCHLGRQSVENELNTEQTR